MSHYEKTINSIEIYKGSVVHLFCDDIELENGKSARREFIKHSGGVCVAAIDDNMNILLVSQFRYPYNEEILEIPAGKLEAGEEPYGAALRELEEETGFTTDKLISLGTMYPSPGYTDEVINIYYTDNLIKTSQKLDEDEFLSVYKMQFWDAYERVLDGRIKDAKTQIAIMKLSATLSMQFEEK